jgi:cyclopropane fatty-acyl-phospholipid synthase-like methyltransferase
MILDKNRGMWLTTDLSGHAFDENLCNSIISFLKKENIQSLVDFGCGHGLYTKKINNSGVISEGYDGNPNTEKLTNGVGKVLDLSREVNLQKKFDIVLSLEVGEHIPPEYEKNFIQNLDIHNSKGIILSWAIKGQGGDGHFNEKNNEDVIEIFKNLNYHYDIDTSLALRRNSTLSWFKNTIMVFRRIQ